jgi:MSHA biogenesis protein MshK
LLALAGQRKLVGCMKKRVFVWILAVLVLREALPAGAQAMSDPMRPQAIAPADDATAAASSSRLQSILISPARKLAVIDGRTVLLGGSVGEATLIAIRESEVVLKKGDERETLKLNPAVQIKPVPRLAPAKAAE